MRFAGSAGNGNKYISAALNANADLNEALSKTAPNWSALTGQSNKAKAEEQIMGMQASASLANAGIQSLGMTKQAQYEAEAIKAGGEAAAAATEAQGMSNMFGGLAGGIGGLFGSKGASAGAFNIGKASTGGFGNFAPLNTGLASKGANAIGMTYR